MKLDPHHAYAETPILIETLAETIGTTVTDVCENLAPHLVDYRPDSVGIIEFINEHITA